MSERDVTLRDGRTLHVYDDGDPDGFVVVDHHGTPAAGSPTRPTSSSRASAGSG